jgi:hypothetical protein
MEVYFHEFLTSARDDVRKVDVEANKFKLLAYLVNSLNYQFCHSVTDNKIRRLKTCNSKLLIIISILSQFNPFYISQPMYVSVMF